VDLAAGHHADLDRSVKHHVMALSYVVAILIFLVLAVLSLGDSRRLLETERQSRGAHSSLDRLDALTAHATDLQDTALSYLLTSNPETLRAHDQAVAGVDADLTALQEQNASRPAQEELLRLREGMRQQQMLTGALIQEHQADPAHAHAQDVSRSVATMESIRGQLLQIQSSERRRLDQLHAVHAQARAWSIVITAGGVLALALILVIGYFLLGERTRRMRAEADLNRFFDSSMDMFCIASMDGFFKRVNPACTQILGYSQAEMLKRPSVSFVHPDDQASTLKERSAVNDGAECHEFENRWQCRDGSWKWLMWNARTDHARKLIFAAGRDITRRKQLEQQVRESEAALALALETEQRSVKEIQSKAIALERSNRELGEFAHVAAHDLQEPLRMVSAYCSMLGESYRGKLGTDADEIIGMAVDGAKRMQVLISDLLVYARVDHGGTSFQKIALMICVEEACQSLYAAIQESHAVVSYEALPEIVGHHRQVTQLLQNLIGNALKYRGTEPPRIAITVAAIEGFWQISVTDNGIGIAPRHHERIFGMFKRLHTREAYSGTGIGLAVCRKIVDVHGGRIWVASELGTGSTFHCTISRTLESSDARKRPATASVTSAAPTAPAAASDDSALAAPAT
jgi:PAS domain S-box-containing protein